VRWRHLPYRAGGQHLQELPCVQHVCTLIAFHDHCMLGGSS
jgi:hypothetical protein